MQHPETHLVTETHGPRPAGRADECFYCRVKVGGQHRPDCVMRQRTVVLRYSYEVVVGVPEDWTVGTIDFHRNDSSWCADNSFAQLETRIGEPDACWCDGFKADFVREANAEDEAKFKLKLLG